LKGWRRSILYAPLSILVKEIFINQTIKEGRILRGIVSFLGDNVVIVKLYQSLDDSLREFSILNRLKQSSGPPPHAPELLDFHQTMGPQRRPYLVLKSFGCPLSHFFSTKSTNQYRLEIGTQLLHSLVWLHQQDLVHCDLKPENVLVEEVGGGFVKVKLCDFECATDVGIEFPSGRGSRGETLLKFTREWVSPEVYLANRSLLEKASDCRRRIGRGNGSPRVLPARKPMDVFPLGLMLSGRGESFHQI
jgi:serine/threonine protein kinase